jgi:ATP-dependent RNA helicase RhlE
LNDLKNPFDALGLSKELVQATQELGYTEATPIQLKAIPIVLEGHDLLAAAQTGTGKTAGFVLPILHLLNKGTPARNNQVRTLILTPTRELAAQVGESAQKYGRNLKLKTNIVFGGVKINPQMLRLRQGSDILVATPGRLLDLYNQNAVKFDHLEILVLDEADRMLDMGFIHDIKRIISLLPKKRQTLLFSATFSDDIRELAKKLVVNAQEVSATPPNAAAPSVKQWLVPVDKKEKANLLIHLVRENNWYQVLVFSRTKHGANKLTQQLENAGIKACAIHGNKSQGARTKALADFKALKVQVMVATDIAARGLDIDQLPQVVNFDLPNVSEDYVHRIGRTGRAGATGQAVSLVSADEIQMLVDIERLIKKPIEREYVEGFEPTHELPSSRFNLPSAKRPNPRPSQPQRARQGDGQKRNDRPRQGERQRQDDSGNQRQGAGSRRTDGSAAPKTDNKNSHNPQRNPQPGRAHPSSANKR